MVRIEKEDVDMKCISGSSHTARAFAAAEVLSGWLRVNHRPGSQSPRHFCLAQEVGDTWEVPQIYSLLCKFDSTIPVTAITDCSGEENVKRWRTVMEVSHKGKYHIGTYNNTYDFNIIDGSAMEANMTTMASLLIDMPGFYWKSGSFHCGDYQILTYGNVILTPAAQTEEMMNSIRTFHQRQMVNEVVNSDELSPDWKGIPFYRAYYDPLALPTVPSSPEGYRQLALILSARYGKESEEKANREFRNRHSLLESIMPEDEDCPLCASTIRERVWQLCCSTFFCRDCHTRCQDKCPYCRSEKRDYVLQSSVEKKGSYVYDLLWNALDEIYRTNARPHVVVYHDRKEHPDLERAVCNYTGNISSPAKYYPMPNVIGKGDRFDLIHCTHCIVVGNLLHSELCKVTGDFTPVGGLHPVHLHLLPRTSDVETGVLPTMVPRSGVKREYSDGSMFPMSDHLSLNLHLTSAVKGMTEMEDPPEDDAELANCLTYMIVKQMETNGETYFMVDSAMTWCDSKGQKRTEILPVIYTGEFVVPINIVSQIRGGTMAVPHAMVGGGYLTAYRLAASGMATEEENGWDRMVSLIPQHTAANRYWNEITLPRLEKEYPILSALADKIPPVLGSQQGRDTYGLTYSNAALFRFVPSETAPRERGSDDSDSESESDSHPFWMTQGIITSSLSRFMMGGSHDLGDWDEEDSEVPALERSSSFSVLLPGPLPETTVHGRGVREMSHTVSEEDEEDLEEDPDDRMNQVE